MLVYQKKCNICKLVKQNKQILQRIYNSAYFVPGSKDSLLKISQDYSLNYKALSNHCKRHQFINNQDYTAKMLAMEDKKAEAVAVRKAVKATDAIQSVMDKGMERLENGEITVDTNQLIRASQVKLNADSKQKDQQLAYMTMIAHFASGSAKTERIYDEPIIEATAD